MKITVENAIALYGAGLSSLLLGWEVFKYLSDGPRLSILVRYNICFLPDDGKGTYVIATVSNVGTSPTTVSSAYVVGFRNVFCRYFGSGRYGGIVNSPCLPRKFEPGDTENVPIRESEDLVLASVKHRLYIVFSHSHSNKLKFQRIKPIRRVAKDNVAE